ncbi:MAG: D-aminoacyl-tRNA deacylase [Chloroflexi bacterium]|nr:D-aminoacyl-tRNA deacylase [Chloroflexota bacterium]
MLAVVQRVREARVDVGERLVGSIGQGLVVLIAVKTGDTGEAATYIATKLATLRIFGDEAGKMNLSVQEVGGAVLIVSQFTLYGETRKGRRPSFTKSARPEEAEPLIGQVVSSLQDQGIPVACGEFGAMMQLSLSNDGPVTIILDSDDREIPRRQA